MQKVVIAGFGFIGGMHAQVYNLLEDAELVAVVDKDTVSARKRLDSLGIQAAVHSSVEEALEKESFTIIDICLPTYLHKKYCLKGIAAGKHLVCEKPLALTLEDGLQIEKAAEEAGVHVQVAHCIRFWPEYIALRDFIQKGEAGQLKSLSLQRRGGRPGYSEGNWLNDEALSGGAALDLHIHDTDYVLYLFGLPEAVSSRATFDFSGPSHIFTRYAYEDVIVEAEGGWNYPPNWGFQMAFQAVFENGAVEFDSGADPTLRVTIGENDPKPLPFTQSVSQSSSVSDGNIQSLGGYFNELEYFIGCLEKGTTPEIATLGQANQSLYTALEEIRSAREGSPVELTTESTSKLS